MVHCKMRIDPAFANPEYRIAAMRNISRAAAFMPRNAAMHQRSIRR
jgi:hypothetical protein